ncbi:MAG: gamma-glutamyl-gamma-aminobutyrate hydrolase family protein [Rikenellaceae bacterium]
MKKVVGVIPLWDEKKESVWMLPGYLDVLKLVGILPIILPLNADNDDVIQLCKMCDGFLFTGGHDVNPKLYDEIINDKCGQPCMERDDLEAKIFSYALENDVPVLGICRGIQLINVLCGGTLYQDLPSEFFSDNAVSHQMIAPYDKIQHKVKILNDTPLYAIISSDEIGVNSYHHQAIKELAPTLKAMAISEDGLIEAVYMPEKKFIWAVQWHPELNYKVDENSRKITASFAQALGK